jgi:hypothetical protein
VVTIFPPNVVIQPYHKHQGQGEREGEIDNNSPDRNLALDDGSHEPFAVLFDQAMRTGEAFREDVPDDLPDEQGFQKTNMHAMRDQVFDTNGSEKQNNNGLHFFRTHFQIQIIPTT